MTDELRRLAEAVPSRPPDRVTYGEWEPVYGRERDTLRATRVVGAIWRTVLEWERHTESPIIDWRRRRIECWDAPSRVVAKQDADGNFVAVTVPRQRIARWEWEYRQARLRGEPR